MALLDFMERTSILMRNQLTPEIVYEGETRQCVHVGLQCLGEIAQWMDAGQETTNGSEAGRVVHLAEMGIIPWGRSKTGPIIIGPIPMKARMNLEEIYGRMIETREGRDLSRQIRKRRESAGGGILRQ